jgi:hypothetical protein
LPSGAVSAAVAILAFAGTGHLLLERASRTNAELAGLADDWRSEFAAQAGSSVRTASALHNSDLVQTCLSGEFDTTTANALLLALCERTQQVGLAISDTEHLLGYVNVFNVGRQRRIGEREIASQLAQGRTPTLDTAGAQDTLGVVAVLVIPVLFGALGAVIRSLRTFAAAEEASLVTWSTPGTLVSGTAFGAVAGAVLGPALGAVAHAVVGPVPSGGNAVANSALAFLVGYATPAGLSLLDRVNSISSALFGSRDEATGSRSGPGIQLLRPINLGTHFVVGTFIIVGFLFGCAFLSGRSGLVATLLPGLAPTHPGAAIAYATLAAGVLGAWGQVTSEVLSLARRSGAAAAKIPLPIPRYLLGALAGYSAGVVLPSIVVVPDAFTSTRTAGDGTALDVFNPFALVLFAFTAGWALARATEHLVLSVGQSGPGGAAAVEEGVRRALAPPPLVNWRGYVNALVRRKPDLASVMDNGKAFLDCAECVLDIFFDPQPDKSTATGLIRIEDGVDEPSATFDVEIIAEGFEPRRRRVQIVSERGRRSKTESLDYRVIEEAKPVGGPVLEARRFRITISQSGRTAQFLSIPVRASISAFLAEQTDEFELEVEDEEDEGEAEAEGEDG